MKPTSHPQPHPRRVAFAGGVLLLVTLTAACGAGSDSSSSADRSGGSAGSEGAASEQASLADGSAADSSAGSAPAADRDVARSAEGAQGTQGGQVIAAERDVISTGNVALRSAEVGDTIFEVQKVLDQVRGQVTERSSETEDDGTVRYARLVLRVPAASFGDTMAALEGVAQLISSDSSSADVTTQVIDTDVRVEVQQRSIDRIQLLLDRAESIKDIVAVEAQLSQREADLGSLQQQQTYLDDQTSLSTITLSVEQPRPDAETVDKQDAGFLAGLSSGWDALAGAVLALSTVLGALLPWMLLGLALAVPGVPLARRLRRRTSRPASAA